MAWLLYSDDDLVVRPWALRQFLLALDPDAHAFTLGANDVGPRFRGARNEARVARGSCRRALQGSRVFVLWHSQPTWSSRLRIMRP